MIRGLSVVSFGGFVWPYKNRNEKQLTYKIKLLTTLCCYLFVYFVKSLGTTNEKP